MEVEALIRSARRRSLFQRGEGVVDLDVRRADIEIMVPHRPPFLFVDAVTAVDVGAGIALGRRHIDARDPVFAGHFPDYPVYPGVLLVETIAQLCLCLHHLLENRGRVDRKAAPLSLRLIKILGAQFITEVRPGDEIAITGKRVEDNGYTQTCVGQVLKGDTVCAVAVVEVIQVDGQTESATAET